MDKEHIKGAAMKAEGAVKETMGKVVGNDRMKAEGRADKSEGASRQAMGDVKDAASKMKSAVKR